MATLTLKTNLLKGSLTLVNGIGMEVPLDPSTLVLTTDDDLALCQGAQDLRTFLTDDLYAGPTSTIQIVDSTGATLPTSEALDYLDSLSSGAYDQTEKLNMEMEMEFKAATLLYFVEFGYTGKNLTSKDIYTSPAKTTQLFGKTFSYTGNNLTQTVLTRTSDGATVTSTFTYTGSNLTSITRT